VIVLFYKEKGFYISLACGIVALVAFAAICMNLMNGDTGNGDESPIVAENTPTPSPTKEPDTKEVSSQDVKRKEVEPTKKPKPSATPKAVETDVKPVKNKLHFDQETGLLWPVNGEILMEYSADKVVYFKTLAQYRTNPALLIAAKKGTEVKASADGEVTGITTSEETGRTLTMDIGDGFSAVYGQLSDITVQKGDRVSEGQVIGKVADPTKYYTMEGANLYFQIREKDQTVNPMVLLR
jgi:Membrane-bound metallopeptidase